VCVRGGKTEVLEGDWTPHRVVLLKFPSVEQGPAFYDSPEYGRARRACHGAKGFADHAHDAGRRQKV
jgi:uncharacterized protein (DUF1330 family)